MSSVSLEPMLREKVRQVARLKGLTVSEVHQQALEQYCDREMTQPQTSRYDDIIGVVEGPSDLSSRAREIFGEIMSEKHGWHLN
jgi:hypothetical protein